MSSVAPVFPQTGGGFVILDALGDDRGTQTVGESHHRIHDGSRTLVAEQHRREKVVGQFQLIEGQVAQIAAPLGIGGVLRRDGLRGRRGLFDQRSVSLGVRYDPRPGLALKAQVERVIAGQSPVVDDLRDPSNERRRLTLFSVALDFAFF